MNTVNSATRNNDLPPPRATLSRHWIQRCAASQDADMDGVNRMLIRKYLQMKSSFGWPLFNLAALLRQQLFIFRDLWAWLNTPMERPPAAKQLCEQLPMPPMW
jgi:hypothetical protein